MMEFSFILWYIIYGDGAYENRNWLFISLKDEYFDVADDDSLMQNHEKGKKAQLILLLKIKIFYGLYQ